MTPDDLDADWRRACRADEVLSRLPAPPAAPELLVGVISRLQGTGSPPDAVLSGLAYGLAGSQWTAAGRVLQRQIGHLLAAALGEATHSAEEAVRIHTILSEAAADLAVDAYKSQVYVDFLTNLPNARRRDLDLEDLTSAGEPFAIASIDLDGLKAINDEYGHPAGSALLKRFGQLLRAAVHGPQSSAYRYGGDEFAAHMAVTSGVLDSNLADLQSRLDVPAFSYGISIWPDDDEDVHTVLQLADRRMYDEKRRRKGIPAAPPPPPSQDEKPTSAVVDHE